MDAETGSIGSRGLYDVNKGLSVGMPETDMFVGVIKEADFEDETEGGTIESMGDPHAISLFDVDPERIQRDMVHRRLDKRLQVSPIVVYRVVVVS